MPLFEMRPEGFVPAALSSFEAAGFKERGDIQRMLRERIESLGDGLMVLDEEFSGWQDSSRRIDLLCLDTSANLVVVELKRNDDGGHMELQALRYAAMVAAMTFEQAAKTLARHRSGSAPDEDAARSDILAFLGWDEPHETEFAGDTRIVLAAADFGKELTTSVMWLRERDIDIRCVRLQPYRLEDGRLLVDIQQIIPLPDAADFQTQLGEKRIAERKERAERHVLRYQFWEALLMRARGKTQLHANRKPGDWNWIGGGIGRAGFSLNYVTRRMKSQVELWIERDKDAFHRLLTQKDAIEMAFGASLNWEEKPEDAGSKISYAVDGGYRSDASEWPQIHDVMIDAMIRLDQAVRPRLSTIRP